MPNATGPDGYIRSEKEEARINVLVASILGTTAGTELMDYLNSITTKRVYGPEVTDQALRHMEGQRFVVAVLAQRIVLGHKEKAK